MYFSLFIYELIIMIIMQEIKLYIIYTRIYVHVYDCICNHDGLLLLLYISF